MRLQPPAERDLGAKLKLYERMGVREYRIALTGKEQLLWNELTETGYRSLAPGADGLFRFRCFRGQWLDPGPVWRTDLPRMFAVL